MKKTLIALMALAGVAAAATEQVNTIDSAWGTAPSTGGNFWGADYSVVFTLNALYNLAESGTIIGYYCGTAVNDSHGYNAITLGGSDDALTLTVGRGRVMDTSNLNTATMNYQDSVTFTTTIQKGVTYTLSVTGGDQAMTPTLTWDGGSETLASYKGNMNGNTANMAYALNPGTITIEVPNVPEPTTATLSLLALAGLAARRRRK